MLEGAHIRINMWKGLSVSGKTMPRGICSQDSGGRGPAAGLALPWDLSLPCGGHIIQSQGALTMLLATSSRKVGLPLLLSPRPDEETEAQSGHRGSPARKWRSQAAKPGQVGPAVSRSSLILSFKLYYSNAQRSPPTPHKPGKGQ